MPADCSQKPNYVLSVPLERHIVQNMTLSLTLGCHWFDYLAVQGKADIVQLLSKTWCLLLYYKLCCCVRSCVQAACQCIAEIFISHATTPWDHVKTMIEGTYYGGRITDTMDRLTFNALLQRFLSPQVLNKDWNIAGVSHIIYSACDQTGVVVNIVLRLQDAVLCRPVCCCQPTSLLLRLVDGYFRLPVSVLCLVVSWFPFASNIRTCVKYPGCAYYFSTGRAHDGPKFTNTITQKIQFSQHLNFSTPSKKLNKKTFTKKRTTKTPENEHTNQTPKWRHKKQ